MFFAIRNERRYILFLGLLAMMPALATDMYLPAMPAMARAWDIGGDAMALSIVLWFAGFAAALPFLGSLSDRFGRRPVLLWGLGVFALSGFLCALAGNIDQLVVFRVLQGMSAAAPSGMCMAICRDRYEGVRRQHALAYVSITLAIAPMFAPSLGAKLLEFASWRFIFLTQGTMGLVGLFIAFIGYEETAGELVDGPVSRVFLRYGNLLRNRAYLLSVFTMGLFIGPFYGYLAFSQKAYITLFGLSEKTFGLFFAANACVSMAGAFASTRLVREQFRVGLMTLCLAGGLAGGVFLLLFGSGGPFLFAVGMGIYSFFGGMSRPMSNHLILDQVDRDIGAASSGIIFYQFMVGAACMAVATVETARPFVLFGGLMTAMTATVLLAWFPLITHLRGLRRVAA